MNRLVWTRVDDDLIVATSAGAHAGYIDRRAQGYYVFDQHARYLDTFPSIVDARAALGEPLPSGVGAWGLGARRLYDRLRTSARSGWAPVDTAPLATERRR